MKTACIALMVLAATAAYSAPPLPAALEPRLVVTNISFAEGPAFDRQGNLFFVIFFTDPQNEDKSSVGYIYRYSAQGRLTRLQGGLHYPNGIVVSADQKHLYVSETWTHAISVFDLGADGAVSNQRVLRQFPSPSVDGLAVDGLGRIWVARLNHPSVDVLSPQGQPLASYDLPGDRVTNLAWWEQSLYVTVAGRRAIYRLDVGAAAGP